MTEQAEERAAGEDIAQSRAVEVSQRVRAVLQGAEEVASAVKAEAEERAEARLRAADEEIERRLEAARLEAGALAEKRREITVLLDDALARSESVREALRQADVARRELEQWMDALAEASRELMEAPLRLIQGDGDPLTAAGAGPPAETDAGPPAGTDAGSPAAFRSDEAVTDRGTNRGTVSSAPRLVAREMADAGSSRGAVAGHLQQTFGIRDPHEILDEIFGTQRADP